MILSFLLPIRWAAFVFLFLSFWPWEKDLGETKKSSLEIPPSAALRVVRVALFYEKPKVLIEIPSPYKLEGLPGKEELSRGSFLASTPILPDAQGIRVGSQFYRVSGLRITTQNKEVEVENKKYHPVIQILKNPAGTLTVVNEIDMEDYLKGVLAGEMNPRWPEEALKAQAVISRTYALFKNIENQEFPFTLSSGVGSQVYQGKEVETFATNRAVARTRGEILTYLGKIFPTFFHSTCGGRTTRAEFQWKVEPHPSLKGVDCPFCRGSRYDHWVAEYSLSEIRNLLAKGRHRVGSIRKIVPDQIDASGRPRFFILYQKEGGSLALSANEFRLALGPDRMRSTRVVIDEEGDRLLFRGRGWGHGVGLCQVGAKRLAELGYRYTNILRYYYPESEIRNLESFVSSKAGVGSPSTDQEKPSLFSRWYEELKSYIEDL